MVCFAWFHFLYYYRLETIWLDELAQKGPQSASLGRVAWKFIRTRAIASTILVVVQYILAFLSIVSPKKNIY